MHPKIFRVGQIYTWSSRWFSRKNSYQKLLKQDIEIKEFLKSKLKDAGVAQIETERSASNLMINIYAAKPGVVIGRGGSGIEELKKTLKDKFLKKENLNINIYEVEKPVLSSPIVLQGMIADLEKRIPYRRVLKQTLNRVERAGAIGAKVCASGRLDGVEIARVEKLSFGRLPLQNLRADIDYAFGEAHTIYGKIGVKVWIYKGDVFADKVGSN